MQPHTARRLIDGDDSVWFELSPGLWTLGSKLEQAEDNRSIVLAFGHNPADNYVDWSLGRIEAMYGIEVGPMPSSDDLWRTRALKAESYVAELERQLEEACEDLTYWQDASDRDDEAFEEVADALEYWRERSSQHWELLKRSAREALQDRKVRAYRDRYYRMELREAWHEAADLARRLEERE